MHMKWYAVRLVFQHGALPAQEAIYEERTLLYRSDSVETVLDRAEQDVDAYLKANPDFAMVGQPALFALNEGTTDLDGAEVWSCLHRGPAHADEFWAQRYERYSIAEER
jgi:hypothetical protein